MNRKICFIGGGLRGGGQERVLTTMANYFAKNGYKISVINLFKTEQFYPLENCIEIIWPKVQRCRYHRLVYAFFILIFLRRSLRRIKPDVILSYGEWFNPFIILSTRFMGIPVYVFDRMGPQIKLDWLIRTSRRILYRFSKGVIVQTSLAAKILTVKTGSKNIKIIPNPLNPIDVEPSDNRNQIVSLGRLSQEKGHIILVRAFNKVRAKEWTLHIIGDGPERHNLENEVWNLDLVDRVHFYGHLKDFRKILGESDIFVLPSLYEGFPNALIEAMSVPLPVISSDCVAGPREIIENGVNGLLVEPGSVEALGAGLNLLIENPDLRRNLATEAKKIRDILSIDKIAKQYLEIFFPET